MNKRIKKKKGLSKITKEELWNLDETLAKFILPRLIKFKAVKDMSYPSRFNSLEEWHEVIDKMIWSFEKHLDGMFMATRFKTDDDYTRYKEGLRLFAECFDDLWD